MKKIIVMSAMLAILPNLAFGTSQECKECCVKICKEETGFDITKEEISHKEWVNYPVISPVAMHKAAKKEFIHCTDPNEYDVMFKAITNGEGDGYYLDKDGTTIYSFDRKEKIYRCAPIKKVPALNHNFSYGLDGKLISGYWSEWSEWVTSSNPWSKWTCTDVCKECNNPSSPVPEPATVLMFGIGILALSYFNRKK